MIGRIVVLAAMLFSWGALAQTEMQLSFGVNGKKEPYSIKAVEMDVDVTARYYAVNGAVTFYNNEVAPIDGTCMSTPAGTVLCNLSLDSGSIAITLGKNLSGTIEKISASGSVMEAAPITILAIR